MRYSFRKKSKQDNCLRNEIQFCEEDKKQTSESGFF
jgi:hypothetical protein